MIAVRGLHHIGVTVSDLAEACDFYCDCGYSISDRLHLTGEDPGIGNGVGVDALDIVFVSSPALTLELLQFDPAGRALTGDDPCFGTVPVASEPPAPADPDGHPVTLGKVHVTLTTAAPTETSRMLALLGFLPRDGGHLVGHGVSLELAPVALAGAAPTANCPGRMHLCVQVTDMDDAVAEVTRAGFDLVSTPRVSGDLRWVFVRHEGGPGIELLCIDEENP